MLPKKNKLPIALFPKTSKVIFRDENLSIRLAANKLNYNRLGVTFKSKAFKTAVLRNRLKRAIFNVFKGESGLFKTNQNQAPGRDLLIILNPPIISLATKDKKEELINKLKIYARSI